MNSFNKNTINHKISNAEILCVGSELLHGDIVNTNAAFLSQKLSEMGISVYYHSVVGDNPERLKASLSKALDRSDLVIMSGGLGPTRDDLTKETVAEYFGLELYLDEPSLADIKAYFKSTHRTMTENNIKQAMMPKGATVFANRFGTAPALAVEEKGKTVIMLPGPPSELEPLFNEQVVPFLKNLCHGAIEGRNIHVFGTGESAIAEKLDDILASSQNPSVAPFCKDGEVRLRVTAFADSSDTALRMCDEYVKKICDSEVGKFVYGVDCDSIEDALLKALIKNNLTFSAAESCTGGLIAKRFTDLSGSSAVFLGGCVTYTNGAKQKLVGVKEETLKKHTAVSAEVAMEMALGVRKMLGTNIGISATGYAGPTGGDEKNPIGTVYIGLSTPQGESFRKLSLSSRRSREHIRNLSATNAFDMILKYICSQKSKL